MPLLKTFVNTNAVKIAEAWRQKGGWEGWLQVELAIAFKSQYPSAIIEREVMVYAGTAQRADLVMTSPNRQNQYIIELKMESPVAGPASFITAFANDVRKVDDAELREGYQKAVIFAIGFSATEKSIDLARSEGLFERKDMSDLKIPWTDIVIIYTFRTE